MSSTTSTRAPDGKAVPRRNSRELSLFVDRSAYAAATPSCRATSKARITPPVVGPTTTSISRPRKRSAMSRQTSEVAAGWRRRSNFSMYWSLWRPDDRTKWPSLSAPESRNVSRRVPREAIVDLLANEEERESKHEVQGDQLCSFEPVRFTVDRDQDRNERGADQPGELVAVENE